MNIKNIVISSMLIVGGIQASFASEVESLDLTVKKIFTFGSGQVWLSIPESNRARTQTCNHYGGDFYFHADEEKGRSILSALMAARVSGKKVGVRYIPTTGEVGSNHNTGCRKEHMAQLKAVYF